MKKDFLIIIESMHEAGASPSENVSEAKGSTISNPRLFSSGCIFYFQMYKILLCTHFPPD